jgi:protein-disulfide isomerase
MRLRLLALLVCAAFAPLAASAQDACGYDPDIPPVEDYEARFITFSDEFKGEADAPVVLIEFFDLNCPHCKFFEPVMAELAATQGENVRIYKKPVAFLGSGPQVQALMLAQREGKFDEMLTAQFAAQQPGGLSVEQLSAIADGIGMDGAALAAQIEAGTFQSEIRMQTETAVRAGVRSVPKVMINGRFIPSSSRSLECMTQLVQAAASE